VLVGRILVNDRHRAAVGVEGLPGYFEIGPGNLIISTISPSANPSKLILLA
jgi:hypothetical protein